MDDQKKDHIDPKRLPKRNRPKQLQTHDVENINGTNKGRGQFLANKPRIVPCGINRIQHRIQRSKRTTLYWSVHPQREQNETHKSSYGLDWLEKYI